MAKLAGRTGHSATDELLKKLTKSTEKKPVKTTKKEKTEKVIDEVVVETEVEEVEEVVEPAMVEETEVEQETAKPKQENKKTDNGGQEISRADLEELFGRGFSPEELKRLLNIYQSYLNNYPLRTTMHKMALIKVCKCTLRYDQALADNDTDSLKVWDAALSKALKEAKINPEQLSAADLSDGMTSFSQLSTMVEKAEDVIPLLPQFIEEPKDRVDYTLWEYINCSLHMSGKPIVSYKEIYGYLSKRYESLKRRYKFLKKEEDGDFDNNDIGEV